MVDPATNAEIDWNCSTTFYGWVLSMIRAVTERLDGSAARFTRIVSEPLLRTRLKATDLDHFTRRSEWATFCTISSQPSRVLRRCVLTLRPGHLLMRRSRIIGFKTEQSWMRAIVLPRHGHQPLVHQLALRDILLMYVIMRLHPSRITWSRERVTEFMIANSVRGF